VTEPYFVDSTVLILALGGEHPLREPSQGLLLAVGQGRVRLHASVEAVQEFTFHRLRRDQRAQALTDARLMARSLVLHPFDDPVVAKMLDLMDASRLRGRDAVHAATAVLAGFTSIVSADRDFDGVPGLIRIDPSELDLTG
jgi:hypothetical protein